MAQKDSNTISMNKAFQSAFSKKEARIMPGAILKFLATGETTGGQFALFEAKALPGFEPPAHIHENEDETYYILEGELWLKAGDKEFTAKKGDFVFLPRGVKHEFKIQSDFLHCQVGIYPAGLENYFLEMTAPAPSFEIPPLATEPPSPEMMEKMMALNEKYGVTYDME